MYLGIKASVFQDFIEYQFLVFLMNLIKDHHVSQASTIHDSGKTRSLLVHFKCKQGWMGPLENWGQRFSF